MVDRLIDSCPKCSYRLTSVQAGVVIRIAASSAGVLMADFNDDPASKVDPLSPEIVDLVSNKLLELRKRLLDFTPRNPLIHIKFRATSTSAIRVVDELPEVLRFKLAGGSQMRLVPR